MIQFTVEKLNLKQVFECGQAFRWTQESDGCWLGVVDSAVVRCWQEGEILFLKQLNTEAQSKDEAFWRNYFDLNRNYEVLKASLLKSSPDLEDALDFGSGIRVLNQDFFEMTITFILSSNNHIPRIRQLVERLSECYGEPLHRLEDRTYYSFPTAQALAGATLEELRGLGLGYRDAYVLETAMAISAMGTDFEAIKALGYGDAKKELLKWSGVGPKVADCILLFGLGKSEAFPIDTWVKKTLTRRYQLGSASQKAIENFVEERFGNLKGFAQQFLFYFERENERS